jgi:hypothetical protein
MPINITAKLQRQNISFNLQQMTIRYYLRDSSLSKELLYKELTFVLSPNLITKTFM